MAMDGLISKTRPLEASRLRPRVACTTNVRYHWLTKKWWMAKLANWNSSVPGLTIRGETVRKRVRHVHKPISFQPRDVQHAA